MWLATQHFNYLVSHGLGVSASSSCSMYNSTEAMRARTIACFIKTFIAAADSKFQLSIGTVIMQRVSEFENNFSAADRHF